MRAKVGWGVTLLGALVALLGIALMVYLGPDGRKVSGPHAIETDGIAIVTAPKTLSWAGLQIDVFAEVPANKPVFVGLGNVVDVNDYIKRTKRISVDGFNTPWNVKTRNVNGRDNLQAAPTSVDWWLADSAGLGGASIDTTLPDQTVRLAILSVGSANLRGLQVTVGYGIKGGFAKGSGLALLGIGGILLGRMLRRGEGFWRTEGAFDDDLRDDVDEDFGEVEEVVYVYIDDDGLEHEISEEEAAQFEVEDLRAEPEPETVAQPVLYVYVDDDGVEHEISEDELHEYEAVDDDEEQRP